MNYTGLYNPFKLNRPLSDDDIKYQLRQDFSGLGASGAVALDDTVVIKMNSTYLELVDKYYSNRGMFEFFTIVMFSSFFLTPVSVICLLFSNPMSRPDDLIELFLLIIAIILPLIMARWFLGFLRKSFFTWTHYPVRLNRKTQMVHIFKVGGTILSVPWNDVFFTRGRAGYGSMPEWSIDGHILADDGKTVIDTFSLGFSSTRRELVKNWAFVRSYMEVDDCLEDLADIIVLCPPVAEKRENYLFGLQYMMRIESRIMWFITALMFPLHLLGSITRFVVMRTCKIPRWSEEVEADCVVDANDPINVSAANNPRHIWRYMLANQPLDEYNALYDRQINAVERLRAKVQAAKNQRAE
ncbi:hypothetical protein GW590_07030 [Rahnella sp. SAP-1]|uniref:DUF6708 domain-containing protein n=1 Tax=Rouxiella aceris TaxID=2703884 RepID=A0A848MHG8_9GAMM|nr:DUF6708 domain-containing protein [Rouxiella aceris]NMP26613.1 hypothetical protein [Rouxiella aceris]